MTRMKTCAVVLGLLALGALSAPLVAAFSTDYDTAIAGTQEYRWCTQSRLRVWVDTPLANYQTIIKQAIGMWNLMPTSLYMTAGGTSTNHEVRVITYSEQDNNFMTEETVDRYFDANGEGGGDDWCKVRSLIKINTYYTNSYLTATGRSALLQSGISHELGHAAGLGHSAKTSALMDGVNNVFQAHQIHTLTPDDLKGLAELRYPQKISLLNTTSVTTGASVLRFVNGSVSEVKVTSAGAGRYAHAHDGWNRGASGAFRGAGITALMQPNTIYRGAVTIVASPNLFDTSMRVGQVEFNDGGIKLTYSAPDLSLKILSLAGTPTAQKYWAQLTWVPSDTVGDGADLYAHVWRNSDDAIIGKAKVASDSLRYGSVTGAFRSGTAAWTDSSSVPASRYIIWNGMAHTGAS